MKKDVLFIYKNGAARLERGFGFPGSRVIHVADLNLPRVMQQAQEEDPEFFDTTQKMWEFRELAIPYYLDFRIFVEF